MIISSRRNHGRNAIEIYSASSFSSLAIQQNHLVLEIPVMKDFQSIMNIQMNYSIIVNTVLHSACSYSLVYLFQKVLLLVPKVVVHLFLVLKQSLIVPMSPSSSHPCNMFKHILQTPMKRLLPIMSIIIISPSMICKNPSDTLSDRMHLFGL